MTESSLTLVFICGDSGLVLVQADAPSPAAAKAATMTSRRVVTGIARNGGSGMVVLVLPNVRAKRAATAGRQGPA